MVRYEPVREGQGITTTSCATAAGACSRSPTTVSSARSVALSERVPLRVSEHEIVIHGHAASRLSRGGRTSSRR